MCEPVRSNFEASLYELCGICSEAITHINASGIYEGTDELLINLLNACSENFWHISDNYNLQVLETKKAPE